MKVLLVKPPFNSNTFIQHFMVCEPLEYEMLAAAIGHSHDVIIVDLRVDSRSLEYYLEKFQPDVVGFTALTMDVKTVCDLARRTKKIDSGIITCVGGEHASFIPEDFEIPQMDFVFRYDALSTFSNFLDEVENLRNKVGRSADINKYLSRRQENSNINDDIGAVKLPRRDLCDRYFSKYIYGCATPINLIQTTAGCPFTCSYCSIPGRQLRYVRRDIGVIIEDMATTKAVDLLSIDANALQDVKKSFILYEEIAQAKLKKRLMISCRTDTIVKHPKLLDVLKRAGVSVIAFGIESLDDQSLVNYEKRNTAENNRLAVKLVHEHGMLVRGNFIIDQQFTIEDFHRLLDDIYELEVEFPSFQILTPLPGTELYKEKKDEIITTNLDYFDLSHSVLPTRLPSHVFYAEFQRLFRVFYGPARLSDLRPSCLWSRSSKAWPWLYGVIWNSLTETT